MGYVEELWVGAVRKRISLEADSFHAVDSVDTVHIWS